ncbi:hypothetical protein EEJ42_36715, partial [Streptomyces botrytidirepellens]
MSRFLAPTPADLESLGRGDGPVRPELLREGARSRTLLLLRALKDLGGDDGTAAGLALLADVQRHSPAAFAAALDLPATGAWAAYCVRAASAAG